MHKFIWAKRKKSKSNEKYDVYRKMYWAWCSYIYSHYHERVLQLIWRKNRVLLKKGCFIKPQNQRFRLKKGFFLSSKIREKGVFFKLGYERGIRFGRKLGGGGSLPPVIPHLSTSVGSCLPYMVFVVAKVIDLQVQLKTKKLKSWEDIFCFVFMCGQNRKIAEYHNTIM